MRIYSTAGRKGRKQKQNEAEQEKIYIAGIKSAEVN